MPIKNDDEDLKVRKMESKQKAEKFLTNRFRVMKLTSFTRRGSNGSEAGGSGIEPNPIGIEDEFDKIFPKASRA